MVFPPGRPVVEELYECRYLTTPHMKYYHNVGLTAKYTLVFFKRTDLKDIVRPNRIGFCSMISAVTT
jgi:hypothetical protein